MTEVENQVDAKQELQRIERMLRDPSVKSDNMLFPYLQRLLSIARLLDKKCDRLASKNEQLHTLVDEFRKSLDLSSRIDPLTRLANRRDIMDRLVKEDSRAQRHWRVYSLILVEVDDLELVKEVNGQNAGDELLVEIACALFNCVRCEDICGRWEGDQFMIILPETTLDGSVVLAEKVVKFISMTEFGVNRSPLRTTVSVAVGEYRPDRNVHEFVAVLEQAVQRAKAGGKNRFVIT